MILVNASGRSFQAAAFVFDKDGLMFESQYFWKELAETRRAILQAEFGSAFAQKWLDHMGVFINDSKEVIFTDPSGIFAVASPAEEVAVTASQIVFETGAPWAIARATAQRIFDEADSELDLSRALKPQKGFPDILRRLRTSKTPYGIATSDTKARARDSLKLFNEKVSDLAFIISPTDVAKGKPNPDMLFRAAELLAVDIHNIVMVGDSYVDTEMAMRAGAIGIGIPETNEMRAKMTAQGAIIVDSLEDILF